MTLQVHPIGGGAGSEGGARRAAPGRRCAFVNNMPDGAFIATEDQFAGLLRAGSAGGAVHLDRYVMDGVPRGDRTRPTIEDCYAPLGHLVESPPDVIVVTGSEPLAPSIRDEPYWGQLAELMEWAASNVPTMLLSCLSAHAALELFDGLARTRLPSKCTGVFPQVPLRTHPLTAGLDETVVLPHSRLNTVEVDALIAHGYDIPLRSHDGDWTVATKRHGRCQVVLVQGHPEYGPASLLLEYQRDLRRYVKAERDELPCLPADCLAGEDWEALVQLQSRLVDGERSPRLLEAFSFQQAASRAAWPWRQTAITIFSNWLHGAARRVA